MDFEGDPAKSEATLESRGFDFRFVTYVFFDPYRIEIEDRRRNYREQRILTVGELDNRFYAVVYTMRDDQFGLSRQGELMKAKSGRIERVSLGADGRLRSNGRIVRPRANYTRLDSAAAFAPDEDTPLLTARQLASARRAKVLKAIDPSMVRKRLKMSQAAFAHVFGVSVRTVQEWEQHRRKPAGAARALLQVIDREPEAVRRAIGL